MSTHLLLSQMNLTTLSFPYKSLKTLSFISTSNHSLPSPSLHSSFNLLLQSPGKPNLVSGHKFKLTQKPKILPFTTKSSAQVDDISGVVKEKSVSVILLAGGQGKRMGANMPKQYLPLLGQPIALYSLYTFSEMDEVKEIIVVCDPSYKDIFEDSQEQINVDLKFALPGKERQDSVYSGLQVLPQSVLVEKIAFIMMHFISKLLVSLLVVASLHESNLLVFGVSHCKEIDLNSELVCIHDSARPLVLSEDVEKVLKDGWINGAAVLGVPVKATIKEADGESFVVRTLDRKTLWEMQTPQVMKPELLKKGFELVNREGLEVTDDVSIVEHLKHPVYITEGSYTNIKVTTPDDLLLAERILST
ncbi:hypothetical protein POTOM_018249 [Populus tomentosa]|uniref:2-C-methyl-D-erythritol 4-phosphate cytidylyltransferase n=1 Tax=Populus tomentosa TaxID=118781 RepID=A0A8X8D4W9_POPTO|nr:hypothetical protein POTOM_018249 [Populus tomentosa]